MEKPVDEVRVRDVMTERVLTFSLEESVPRADLLMRLARLRHVPVIDTAGNLAGLVTHRDLLTAQIRAQGSHTSGDPTEHPRPVTVGQIMRTDVWTITPDATALAAATLMRDHQFGCLPVVWPSKLLVGIITEADIVALCIEALLPDGRDSSRLIRTENVRLLPSVREVMTLFPATIDGNETAAAVREHFARERIHHLPIMIGDEVAGVISDSDIRVAEAAGTLGMKVAAFCRRTLLVVSANARLGAVARDMADQRVGSALVIDAGELVGIITSADVARALAERVGITDLPPSS